MNSSPSSYYALSPLQEGMLYHSLLAPGSGVYMQQMICRLNEPLNLGLLQTAWQQIMDRHSILKTELKWDGLEAPLQRVVEETKIELKFSDWKSLSPQEQKSQFQEYQHADRHKDFDLTKAPLMRVAVFAMSDQEFHCLWTFHHMLVDGRSSTMVLNEVFNVYGALMQNQIHELEPVKPYVDYINWLDRQDFTNFRGFWEKHLSGFTTPTVVNIGFPKAFKANRVMMNCGAEEIVLSEELTMAIEAFASDNLVTTTTLLQGAWAILLHRYSHGDDIVFGTVRACRYTDLEGIKDMVGLFINTLPMRILIDPEEELVSFLKKIRRQYVSFRDCENTPTKLIHQWSEVSAGLPLYETTVVFENLSHTDNLRTQGGDWMNREFKIHGQAEIPVNLWVTGGREMTVKIRHDSDRFDAASIKRTLGHFKELLMDMIGYKRQAPPQGKIIKHLNILPAEERDLILGQSHIRGATTFSGLGIPQYFENQVAKTPENIAVACEGLTLTYQELNSRSNQLAHYLKKHKVVTGDIVGLCVDRSLEMMVGILGILKAGAAYLPLDPHLPEERLSYIISDSSIQILLTQTEVQDKIPNCEAQVFNLDTDWEEISNESSENEPLELNVDSLAYIIYTSGSTGNPKGVMVTHHNVIRLMLTTEDYYHFDETDIWSGFFSYSFDFSVWEFWGALFYGGKLVIVPKSVSISPNALHEFVLDEKVTVLNQTPSAFRQLIEADQKSTRTEQPALRFVIFGGEALELQILRPWFNKYGNRSPKFINMYGITETTVHSTYREITKQDLDNQLGSVIGEALPDLQIYVLDDDLRPVPMGIAGEICVGGDGVALGYLNRPELTSERFVLHPFDPDSGQRLYRSGDLARFLEDGDLEYLGRIDHQVKIRGFRIELGEIENILLTNHQIREAIVAAVDDNLDGKKLVGYLVAETNNFPDVTELRYFLKQKLPEYMIPSNFVMMDVLPLTHNGKVDRKKLPDPVERPNLEVNYSKPQNETEQQISEIWMEVLNLQKVGIEDNFFDLGGHSMNAVQVHTRIQKIIEPSVTLVDLFQYPTVSSLARHINGRQGVGEGANQGVDHQLDQQGTDSAEEKRLRLRRNRIRRS